MSQVNSLISVIVPVYNAADTLELALLSILAQKKDYHFQVIIINDGSKDNSLQIAQNFIDSNTAPNITYKLIDQPNGGVSRARNAGLKAVTGDYIAFLDSDDEWLPTKTALQMAEMMQHPEVDYLGGRIGPAPLKSHFLKKFDGRLTQIFLRDLIFKNYFQPSTVIFKTAVLQKIGLFREDQRYAEEGNYFMRVANQFNCYLLDEQVIIYGQGKAGFGASGLSANIDAMEKGELMNLNFARKHKYIPVGTYLVALAFSIVKYARRKAVFMLKSTKR